MQKSQPQAAKGGLGIEDILYVLFKHKWKILVLTFLGLGAAVLVYKIQTPIYQSQAKLLVRYVINRVSVDSFQDEASIAGASGRNVIDTEIEILTSVDLAIEVATKVGVETLVPDSPTSASPCDVAGVILNQLEVTLGQSSNVLYVSYGNPDPELSKTVLKQVIESYFEKHLEIHRSAHAFDVVAKQTEEIRARLEATEKHLNELRSESGILSMADATGGLSAQRVKTREDLMEAKAQLAEKRTNLEALEKALIEVENSETALDTSTTTGNITAVPSDTNPIPVQAITEYRTVLELLTFLKKKDLELQIKFKAGNRLLILNQQQIETYDAKRIVLVSKYPNLAAHADEVVENTSSPRWNLISEKAGVEALVAKIGMFETLLKEIGDQFRQQYAIGAEIEEAERRRQMEDNEYRSIEVNLKNAKVDQTLDPTRMPNITMLQQPTQPFKIYDKKIQKIVIGLAGGGLIVGVSLAFMIELLFDRRVKRPMEIHARLQLPLLLSIPYHRDKNRLNYNPNGKSGPLKVKNANGLGLSDPAILQDSSSDQLKKNYFILSYAEAIRDRIIFNFEINDLTHKPKLVAVTGLSEGAGASTIAAGLAKAFSEIKGAKVLLVDLSSCNPNELSTFGAVQRHSLNGALQLATHQKFKDSAQSLYFASATARRDDSGLTNFSPMHLFELMPQLQASEFDYIIFDMPLVDQTSRTLTMAGLMDKVLLVLDAENTSRDALKWGYSELIKGRADVSCIFNKTRTHAPSWAVGDG